MRKVPLWTLLAAGGVILLLAGLWLGEHFHSRPAAFVLTRDPVTTTEQLQWLEMVSRNPHPPADIRAVGRASAAISHDLSHLPLYLMADHLSVATVAIDADFWVGYATDDPAKSRAAWDDLRRRLPQALAQCEKLDPWVWAQTHPVESLNGE